MRLSATALLLALGALGAGASAQEPPLREAYAVDDFTCARRWCRCATA